MRSADDAMLEGRNEDVLAMVESVRRKEGVIWLADPRKRNQDGTMGGLTAVKKGKIDPVVWESNPAAGGFLMVQYHVQEMVWTSCSSKISLRVQDGCWGSYVRGPEFRMEPEIAVPLRVTLPITNPFAMAPLWLSDSYRDNSFSPRLAELSLAAGAEYHAEFLKVTPGGGKLGGKLLRD